MLNHINHKMPIYKDCTLWEIVITAAVTFVILTMTFSFLSIILLGFLWPGYLIASALFFFMTKLILSRLQKLKYGKPHAYYQQLVMKKLSQLGLIKSPYLMRVGQWSVSRRIHS